jgi:hypothetical protein
MVNNPFITINERFDQIESLIKNLQKEDRPTFNPNERLTRKQVCKEYKVSYATIHKLMNDDLLVYEKIGRKTLFKRQSVENCFKTRKRGGRS